MWQERGPPGSCRGDAVTVPATFFLPSHILGNIASQTFLFLNYMCFSHHSRSQPQKIWDKLLEHAVNSKCRSLPQISSSRTPCRKTSSLWQTKPTTYVERCLEYSCVLAFWIKVCASIFYHFIFNLCQSCEFSKFQAIRVETISVAKTNATCGSLGAGLMVQTVGKSIEAYKIL